MPMSRHIAQKDTYMPAMVKTATHVYVKEDKSKTTPLAPRWSGPYPILDRPSNSTLKIKIGTYASGQTRTQIVHWNNCRVAFMRDGQKEASRPKLGRPPQVPPNFVLPPPPPQDTTSDTMSDLDSESSSITSEEPSVDMEDIQEEEPIRPIRSTRNPDPKYVWSTSNSVYSVKSSGPPPYLGFPSAAMWTASPSDLAIINQSISRGP